MQRELDREVGLKEVTSEDVIVLNDDSSSDVLHISLSEDRKGNLFPQRKNPCYLSSNLLGQSRE